MNEREHKPTYDQLQVGSTELNLDQLEVVSGGDQKLSTTLPCITSIEHETLKAAANNLRA
jgi:hypothetical protein